MVTHVSLIINKGLFLFYKFSFLGQFYVTSRVVLNFVYMTYFLSYLGLTLKVAKQLIINVLSIPGVYLKKNMNIKIFCTSCKPDS